MILILEKSREERMRWQRIFYHYGMTTLGCGFTNAWSFLEKNKVDGVFLPNLQSIADPLRFCTAFRAAHPHLPFVVALPEEESEGRLYRLSFHVSKILLTPASHLTAIQTVLEVCRMATKRDFALLKYGVVELDIYHRGVVRIAGTAMRATLAESSILRCLAEAAPEAVTAEELCRRSGDPAHTRGPSSIRTLIQRINQRAVTECGRPCILCLRGRGYTVCSYPQADPLR